MLEICAGIKQGTDVLEVTKLGTRQQRAELLREQRALRLDANSSARLERRLQWRRGVSDKVELDGFIPLSNAEAHERHGALEVIDLQAGASEACFDLAWNLAQLDAWPEREIEIARLAMTEVEPDQCTGPKQRPSWLHAGKLVEYALLEWPEAANAAHRSS